MTTKEKWEIENVIWGICGGWLFAAIWYIMGVFFHVIYIGRPVAKSCFLIARFAAKPHGRVVGTTGDYNFIANLVWMFFFGVPWTIVFMFISGVFALTLVGIPVAMTYLRLAGLVACPVGMQMERQLEDWEWQ